MFLKLLFVLQGAMPPNADDEERRLRVVQGMVNNTPWRHAVEPDVVSKVSTVKRVDYYYYCNEI